MADSYLNSGLGKVQSWTNTISGQTVHTRASTVTDNGGYAVAGRPWYVDATPTVTAATYASGDIIINNATLLAFAPANDIICVLCGIECLDQSDQAWGMNIVFHKASQSIGTVDSAITVSAANAANLAARVSLFQSEAEDWINSKRWSNFGLSVPLKPTSGTDDINYSVIINQSTPTLTNNCLSFRFWFKSNA